MYLIDGTYFIKNLVVPNSNASLDIPNNEVSLEVYIDEFARQLLQKSLGHVLFTELDSHISNGVLGGNAPTKWNDLVNGKTYTHDGESYTWKGLLFIEGAFKGSILAHYVYLKWHEDQLSTMSSMGEIKGKAINSQSVNSTSKHVKLWNEYIEMYQGSKGNTYTFSRKNGIDFHDYYNGTGSGYVCLLDFLSHNESDYPDALMTLEEGVKNTMGI